MTRFTSPFTIEDTQGNQLFSIDDNYLNSSIKGQYKIAKVATIIPGGTAETDTGFVLPVNCVIKDIFLNVINPEVTGSNKAVNIGLLGSQNGNTSGFLNGISVANTGITKGQAKINSGNYYESTTRGVYLANFYAGGSTSFGLNYEHSFTSNSVTARNISYTRLSNFNECIADIYIEYLEL